MEAGKCTWIRLAAAPVHGRLKKLPSLTRILEMKKLILVSFLLSAALGLSGETVQWPISMDSLKTRLRTYEGVKITGADAVGIRITHEGGTARIPYRVLEPEMAARFGGDTREAEEQEKAEAAAQDAYHQAMTVAVQLEYRAQAARKAADVAAGIIRKSDTELQEDALRMMELQEYVTKMRGKIAEAEKYIERRQERVARLSYRASSTSRNCGSGWSPSRRTYYILRMAHRKQEKVNLAKRYVEQALGEMAVLEGAR